MTAELIGGHKTVDQSASALEVWRMGDGTIQKRAFNDEARRGIQNESRFLVALQGTGFAPELYERHDDLLVIEDMGVNQPVTDDELLRRNATLLLWALRSRRIRHGDLTGVNVIIREGNRPVAIDFGQSHFLDEPHQDKQARADGYHLWRVIAYYSGDENRTVRRWQHIRAALGGNAEQGYNALAGRHLFDLGTHMGDFPAMGAAEGMMATGVDNNRIRDGLRFAASFWPKEMEVAWYQADIMEADWDAYDKGDVVLWLRTWPYHVETHGRAAAEAKLAEVVAACHVLFFEPQLHGDGPGPDFLPDLDAVRALCLRCGAKHAEPICTLPTGRPKETTTWEVRR